MTQDDATILKSYMIEQARLAFAPLPICDLKPDLENLRIELRLSSSTQPLFYCLPSTALKDARKAQARAPSRRRT